MRNGYSTPARNYYPGIGEAVANRTINRKIAVNLITPNTIRHKFNRTDDQSLESLIEAWSKSNGYVVNSYNLIKADDMTIEVDIIVSAVIRNESWEDVATRVAKGNALLEQNREFYEKEFHDSLHHLRQASILMSGRHLQHGDETQPERNIEVYSNCSTAANSFTTFYLLLNGAGVGRSYDDHMMVVDWSNMPIICPVIDQSHKDILSGEINIIDLANANHIYSKHKNVHHYRVPDSREGWAQAIEKIEVMTFDGDKKDHVLIIDFSDVRHRGAPIGGMQKRPASGPGPLINAIKKISTIRDSQMPPWRAAMFIDHYLAECVLVGGARRAARMSVKNWKDDSVVDFIEIKRGGFLWSSNNSVMVDQEFWNLVKSPENNRAKEILELIAQSSYNDGTGEPGLINQDKLVDNKLDMEVYNDGIVAESSKYKPLKETKALYRKLLDRALSSKYSMIVNPCSEICLFMLGAYCLIGDVVPYHAVDDSDAEDAFRTITRMLIRTNTMDALYGKETNRTNRIGVSITGLHEYAWKRFGYGWKDLIDENKSKDFWLMLEKFRLACEDEAKSYSSKLGMNMPHTVTTIKPAGTTSKIFGLTEGAHLPSMREYLRWVQFRNDDPLITQYQEQGYPVKKLKTYSGTTIVGFPTRPEICELGMGDKLVTAGEATPEEQYQYLRLLEKYWIGSIGNQVSYTLKFYKDNVDYASFKETLINGQSSIKCCSVMPQMTVDESAYEYLPEEAITKEKYEHICMELRGDTKIEEDISIEHVDCSTGACPINWNENK